MSAWAYNAYLLLEEKKRAMTEAKYASLSFYILNIVTEAFMTYWLIKDIIVNIWMAVSISLNYLANIAMIFLYLATLKNKLQKRTLETAVDPQTLLSTPRGSIARKRRHLFEGFGI